MAAAQQPVVYACTTQSPMVPVNKRWERVKIGLTVASLILSVVVLGVSIAVSIYWPFWVSTWCAPVVVTSGLWDTAELFTQCARRRGGVRRGIHPGAHVGVDLILCLALAPFVFATALGSLGIAQTMRRCSETDPDDPSYGYLFLDCSYYSGMGRGFLLPAMTVLAVFVGLLLVIHFVLFVRACVDTSQRNRNRVLVQNSLDPFHANAAPAPPVVIPGRNSSCLVPMMPPQAHVASAGEKSTGQPQMQQGNYAALAGFYAPGNNNGNGDRQLPA